MGDEENTRCHLVELGGQHSHSDIVSRVPKVYAVASPPVPIAPVVVSRRALEDDAATIHVEGVEVNPETGVSVVTKKVTTSFLYQVPSACGQYRLRRPTATVFAHLTPPRHSRKIPWMTNSNRYETFPLTNPSLCPTPHPSVITLSGRWTRALKFRQHTTSTPSRSETEEGSPTSTPTTTIVDRDIEIFHQETIHRNRTMHGATPEGVEASPMVVQHRLGVDNGVSSIDLTTFDQRFPVQGLVSDGYRMVATLSNPVMLLMGNHTHVTSPYHLPGGVTASALPRINAIHIYWAVVEAAGRSGGAVAEEEEGEDGGAVMGLANLDRLRMAIQREIAEQEDNDADISTHQPQQQTKKPSRANKTLQMVEEAIAKQRVLLESRGLGEGVRPPCEVPHLFCGTANGDIIEHSLSNRYMHWLDRKQESLTATPATRFFKKWERRMRKAAGEDTKMLPRRKKQTAKTHSQDEREDSVETAIGRAQRLLASEGGVFVEDWGTNEGSAASAAASASAAPGAASQAELHGDSEVDDWDVDSEEDADNGDSEGNALDLLSRPGIPCRCLYSGTVPIRDIKLSHTVSKKTAFHMVALLRTSELLIFEASDPVWSVPSSTLVPVRRIYPVVPITLQPSSTSGIGGGYTAASTTRDTSDATDVTAFIEQPKGPFGCIPPVCLPHTPIVPPATSCYRLVRLLDSPENVEWNHASSCVQLNKVIANKGVAELLSRMNVLGPKAFSANQTNANEENNNIKLILGQSPVFTQFSLDMDGEQMVMVAPHSRVVCGFSFQHMLQPSDHSSLMKGFSPYVAEPIWLVNSTYSPTAVKSVSRSGMFIVASDHEVLSIKCSDQRQRNPTLHVTTIFQTQFSKTVRQLEADTPSTHNELQQLSHCCQVRPNSGFISPWQLQEVAGLKNNDNKSFLINDSSAAVLIGATSTLNSAGQGGNPLKNNVLIGSAHSLGRAITQRFGSGAIERLCHVRGVAVGDTGLPTHPELLLSTLLAFDGDRRDMIVGFDLEAKSERCVVSSMTSVTTVPIPPAGSLKAVCLGVLSLAIEGFSSEIDILKMKQHFDRVFGHSGAFTKWGANHDKTLALRENLQETRFDLMSRDAASCVDRNTSTCPRGHVGMSLRRATVESNIVDPSGSSEAYSALFYDTMEDYGADGGNVEEDGNNTQTENHQILQSCQISAYRTSQTKLICGGCGLDIQRAANALEKRLPFLHCAECAMALCIGCAHCRCIWSWE